MTHSTRRMHAHQQGFTLFELVMVIIIIGVLAAIAIPRFSLQDSSVHAQAAQVARDIRHAQMLAMSQGRTLTFQSLGTTYRCVDSTGTVITDPATQQPFNFTLNNGVSLSVGTVNFDSLGRPVSGGTLVSAADIPFTVSGETQTSNLTVSRVTGFVAVSP